VLALLFIAPLDDDLVGETILVVCGDVEDMKASQVVAMNGVEISRIQIMEIIGNTLKKDDFFDDQEQS